MIDLNELIQQISTREDCRVFPPAGLPLLHDPAHRFPDDLLRFYSLCGGVLLWTESDYWMQILGPEDVRPADMVQLSGQDSGDELDKESPTADWYLVARCGDAESISIDLNLQRLGLCYDSSPECFGLPGSSPVVAKSFSELVCRLFANEGEYWYWQHPDFVSLGDAFN